MSETQTHAFVEKHPGGGLGQWVGLAGAAVAVAVIVVLVVSWPNHEVPAANLAQTSAPAEAATPAKGRVRVRSCGPIFGGGSPHRVTSSGTAAAPAGCGEAHSVLLSALNGGGSTVGGWHCTGAGGGALERCTSAGGRRIMARG
jgi:hypothetical protein